MKLKKSDESVIQDFRITQNEGGLVLYKNEKGDVKLRADVGENTMWATQAQIATIFETTPQNITVHLRKIYSSEELSKKPTCKFYLQVQKEGGRSIKRLARFYNLDTIIAVGYRVNSKKATQFRIWATSILRDYLVKGYSLNKYKLGESEESFTDLRNAVSFLESGNGVNELEGELTLKLKRKLINKKHEKNF